MKEIIVLFIFFTFFVVNSQTRKETEQYILNKLKIYSTKLENYNYTIFSLDGNNFVVDYNPVNYNYEKIRYVFPVWAIENVTLKNFGEPKIEFSFKKYCNTCKKYLVKLTEGYETYGYDKEQHIKSFSIQLIDAEPEEDFIGRFSRAINHLKGLYPNKPKTKDLFGN